MELRRYKYLSLLGFAFGPIVFGPISEIYGRRWSLLPATLIMGLFSIGSAVSKDTSSLLATRFLAGVFGSSPIANVSAALGDIYEPKVRGVPMALMAACVVGGALLAPIIGAGLNVNKHLGWRCKEVSILSPFAFANASIGTEYIEALIAFFSFAVTVTFMPETYTPVLLRQKAKMMRKTTGDDRYWHPHENEKINLHNVVTKHLNRPIM